MLDMDKFTKKPEVIFMNYNELIRNPYPFLLRKILTEYRKYYEDFLDFSSIENLDDNNLLRYCIQRTDINVFTQLAKREFDYGEAMKDIFNRFPDMYSKSEKLVMGDSLHMILSQGFTEKVYVYTPEYDERVHVDLNDTYRNPDKLKYITGDFANIIEDFDDITTFIFNDIIDISTLIAFNKTKYTNILVANYGYNFTIDDNGNLTLRIDAESMMEEYVFKFSTFTPAKLGSEHFSQVQT